MPILHICERHSRVCGMIDQCCLPKDVIMRLKDVVEYEIVKCNICKSEERAEQRVAQMKKDYWEYQKTYAKMREETAKLVSQYLKEDTQKGTTK